MTIDEAIKDNCDGKCTYCNNTELPNIKDCKDVNIGYSYAYKTDCAGDRYIKAEEVKYLLERERVKVIDDFVANVKDDLITDYSVFDIDDIRLFIDTIEEIAEQLKAGV